nr:hypothetical protein [Borreliella garinii]
MLIKLIIIEYIVRTYVRTYVKEVDSLALCKYVRTYVRTYVHFFRQIEKGNRMQGFAKYNSKKNG